MRRRHLLRLETTECLLRTQNGLNTAFVQHAKGQPPVVSIHGYYFCNLRLRVPLKKNKKTIDTNLLYAKQTKYKREATEKKTHIGFNSNALKLFELLRAT